MYSSNCNCYAYERYKIEMVTWLASQLALATITHALNMSQLKHCNMPLKATQKLQLDQNAAAHIDGHIEIPSCDSCSAGITMAPNSFPS